MELTNHDTPLHCPDCGGSMKEQWVHCSFDVGPCFDGRKHTIRVFVPVDVCPRHPGTHWHGHEAMKIETDAQLDLYRREYPAEYMRAYARQAL